MKYVAKFLSRSLYQFVLPLEKVGVLILSHRLEALDIFLNLLLIIS